MDTTTTPLEDGWQPETPIEDSLLRRFLHNQAQLNELLADELGGRVVRTSGASVVDCGSPVAHFNQTVLLRPLLDIDDPTLDTIEEVCRATPFATTLLSLWPTPDLRARGWDLVGHPMLVARAPGPVPAARLDGVRVVLPRSAGELRTAERVAIDGYPLDVGAADGPLFPAGALDRGLSVRVATLGDEPVAVGNGHVSHGVVNLCFAATLEGARRRGAWSALVWSRVADAPDLPALAFTSDDSRPGFERLGFLPLIRLTLWTRPG